MRHAFTFEVEPFEFQSEFEPEYAPELARPAPRRTSRKSPGTNMSQHRARTPNKPKPRPRPQPLRVGSARREYTPSPCVCPQHKTEFVRWVQHSLNQVLGLQLPVSGVMNAEARRALRRFQKEHDLPEDGIAGPETEKALIEAKSQSSPATEDPPSTSELFDELDSETLDLFDNEWEGEVNRNSREYALWVQQSLNKILGLRLAVDGIIGTLTRSAIRSFQQQQVLTADGIVGPITESTLTKLGAGAPPGAIGTPPYSRGTYLPPRTPGTTPSSSGAAARIVAEARKHVGYKEGPNNQNKFSTFFGRPPEAWCADFVSYVYTQAKCPLDFSWTVEMLQFFKDTNRFTTAIPSPGDVVVFDWDSADSKTAQHVGIVESVSKDASGNVVLGTIEGNAGTASDGVYRRTRNFGDSTIVGYGRIAC